MWRRFGLYFANETCRPRVAKHRWLDGSTFGANTTEVSMVHFYFQNSSQYVQVRGVALKTHLETEIHGKKLRIPNTFYSKNQNCRFSRCQHRLAPKGLKTPDESKINDTSSVPPLPEDGKKKTKATNYFVAKFQKFIDGYQAILEKKFPGAMNVYRVFVVGFKEFSREFAQYVRIRAKVIINPGRIHNFSRKELEVYYRMPSEIFKVGPTLLISALPFANYVVFPIAYYFPKRLLSSHFWSIQQKSQFAIEYQRDRYHYYRPIFRHLQKNVDLVEDAQLYNLCSDIFSKLGSGVHPTIREIMQIKPLFESHPFSLKAIYGPHVKGLCRMFGIHTMYFSRSRLYDHAEMLYDLDVAIVREGISRLKTDELRYVCFMRGLNASNTSHEDMLEYLHQWIAISTIIYPDAYSLLLHLPVFLGYNNPNNWALKM